MGDFTVPLWLTVTLASSVGVSMYAMYRLPKETWRFIVGSIFTGTAMGPFLTFGICEFFALQSAHYHHIGGFLVGLLGIPVTRVAINLVETQGVQLLIGAIRRLLPTMPAANEEKSTGDQERTGP